MSLLGSVLLAMGIGGAVVAVPICMELRDRRRWRKAFPDLVEKLRLEAEAKKKEDSK